MPTTDRGTVWAYDYDLTTGTPSNKRQFICRSGWNPDGMCMDPDGRLLVAVYGGAAVEIYSVLGELAGQIELSVPNVTSCDIGSDGTLYITTAFRRNDGRSSSRRPRIRSGVRCRYGDAARRLTVRSARNYR